jgi:hypothetical protein
MSPTRSNRKLLRLLAIGGAALASSLPVAAAAAGLSSEPTIQASMLVWSSSDTREEASASLAEYQRRAAAWSEAIELAKGFPKVIESSAIPGLDPGSYLVALGVCDHMVYPEFRNLFSHFDGRISQRVVEWAMPLPCPRIAPGWRVGTTTALRSKQGNTLDSAQLVKTKPGVRRPGSNEDAAAWWVLVLESSNRRLQPVAEMVYTSDEVSKDLGASQGCPDAVVGTTLRTIVIQGNCPSERGTCSRWGKGTVTFSIDDDGQLRKTVEVEASGRFACDE